MEHIILINISDIVDSPYQGRFFETHEALPAEDEKRIAELTRSIELNGLMQPIVVRKKTDNTYELIDGHRRIMAYKRLSITEIKAIVKNYNDKEAQLFSIIGNLQRKNLSPIETAFAFRKVLNQGAFYDQRDLSQSLGKDETYVSDVLNLLNMDSRIIDDLLNNKSINDVRILRMIRNAHPLGDKKNCEQQWQLYTTVLTQKLNRKQLAHLIKQGLKAKTENVTNAPKRIQCSFKNRTADIKISMAGLDNEKKRAMKKLIDDFTEKLNENIQKLNI
jgi:ParB family transcriptional regulator, chromosome partitioning protein